MRIRETGTYVYPFNHLAMSLATSPEQCLFVFLTFVLCAIPSNQKTFSALDLRKKKQNSEDSSELQVTLGWEMLVY